MNKFLTIYDIEVEYQCYFSDSLKTKEVSDIFLEIFNTGNYTDLISSSDDVLIEEMLSKNLLIFNSEDYGKILQIIGLYHKMIKNDFETAILYFKKAIEKNNMYAYVSLSTTINDNVEKLNYLLKCHELDNNNESALINLCIYYMYHDFNEEKMLYYTNIGFEKKIPQIINNLGVFYANKNDFENASKYFIMASELDFYDSYFNLFLYSKTKNDIKIKNKCMFYTSIYLPVKMIRLYESIYIDTDEKDVLNKIEFYQRTRSTSLEEYLEYKEGFNQKIMNVINYYKMCKKNMYYKDTNLLLGNLIGKEKLKELSEKAMDGNIINETLQLSNSDEIKFVYRACNL